MHNKNGTTMIEVLVAMVILAIISSAIILVTLQILSVNNSARLKNQATTYAEQILEQVKDYSLNSSGYSGMPNSGCYTFLNGSWNSISCPTSCTNAVLISDQSVFYRHLRFTSSSGSKRVTVTVYWKDKANCKSTVIDTYYYSL